MANLTGYGSARPGIGRVALNDERHSLVWPAIPELKLSSDGFDHRLMLRGSDLAARERLACLGLDAPEMLRTAHSDRAMVMRLGPEEWFIGAVAGSDIQRILVDEPGIGAFDVSHGFLGLSIEGAGVEQLLQSHCPLDLNHARFKIGMATRTVFGKTEVLLSRMDSARFNLVISRSQVRSVLDLLAETVLRQTA
ncbi:COG4583 Sarcosine oxidase gamma subunit [Rhabdaerophilaceae bacterium]